ncbi:ferric reductase (plasmid) [Deinococcus sp. KNUC1210]|uniref:ferric reductase n=1 Tax=Deinococcus sp. KNUC1210 TaxID=2917691 RepID=UPI001EF0557C|nr:ferric reductase [Deinococcus sp. KNUC1210]ULH17558.1 ferric reductase [Deinococcus sp. KNUC1210]
MTQTTAPISAKAPRTTPLNMAVTALLLGLVLLAWVLSWQGTLSQAWPQVLLTQTGTFSYVLLVLAATLGPLIGTRFLPQWLTAGIKTGWHGIISGFALVVGMIHGLFATVGHDALSALQVVVPGLAPDRTLAMAMGTVGLWGMLLVYVTWLLRGRIGIRAARALHLLAYPTFVAATLHGVWLGHGSIDPTYVLGSLAVGSALAVRLITLARR